MVGLEISLDPEANYLRFNLLEAKNPIIQEWKQLCLDSFTEYPKLFSRIDLFEIWNRFETYSRYLNKLECLNEVYYSIVRDIKDNRATTDIAIYLNLIVKMFQLSKYYRKHCRMKLSKIFNDRNYDKATIATMCNFTLQSNQWYFPPYYNPMNIEGIDVIPRFGIPNYTHFQRMLELIIKWHICKSIKERY